MVRKIGNIYFLISIIAAWQWCCATPAIDIDFRILDEKGVVKSKTGIGIPTTLEVIAAGLSQQPSKIYVDGLKDFDVEQRGTTKQVSTINGVTSTKTIYRYLIRAKQEGTYTIGPATIRLGTKVYSSGQRKLQVQRGYVPASSESQKAALELHVGKERVVVGEKIPLRLRFYCDKDSELLGIEPLELQDGSIGLMKGPFTGTAEHAGRGEQKYIEWHTDIVPHKAGEFVIPPLKAHYKVPQQSAGLPLDFFGGLFDFGYSRKYVYSNTIAVQVDSLPKYDGTVHAIGVFTAFRAQLSQATAKEGEGIVLTLELEGEGDFDAIPHPRLELPAALTYYDSNSMVSHTGTKKSYEYIVQGIQPGTWTVQSQEFVFFDSNDRMYKILQTPPLEVTILPGASALQKQETDSVQEVHQDSMPSDDIWPVHEEMPQNEPTPRAFSHTLFLLGLLLPLVISLARASYGMFHWYRTRDLAVLKKKRAFVEAKKKIKAAAKTHHTAALYDIFITFVADRYAVDQAEVSSDIIRHKLVGLSQATEHQWEVFFGKVTEQAYAHRPLTLQEKEELFKSALMWLTLFEKSEKL